MVTKQLLTVDELAHRYNVTRNTIYRWIRQGMPFIQVGPANRKRFDVEAIEAWHAKQNSERQSPGK